MGAVELVIQVGALPTVSSGLQRVGRTRHQVGGVPEGVSFPKHDADLLASAVVSRAMLDGAIEASRYPRNPLDVLSQQIAAMVAMDDWTVPELHRFVRQCAPYRELSRSALENVLDMMSGRYPADDFSELRPTIVWDRMLDTLSARKGCNGSQSSMVAPLLIVFQAGVYNDTEEEASVGELDEEMVWNHALAMPCGASSGGLRRSPLIVCWSLQLQECQGKCPFGKGINKAARA